MKSVPQPEHWSKDFVEHLRTVHFALLTVSLGLILLLSSKPYDVQKAQIQLEEILLLKSWWAPNGLTLPGRLPFGLLEMQYTAADPVPNQSRDDSTSKPLPVTDTFEAALDLGTEKKNITFVLPQVNWYWCRQFKGSSPAIFFDDPEAPREFPNRMRDLPQWWKRLDNNYSVYRVVEVLPIGAAAYLLPHTGSREGTVTISELNSGHAGNDRVQLSLTPSCQHTDSFLSALDGRGHAFIFRIHLLLEQRMSQSALNDRFMDLTPGPFEKTFSNLVKATRGREDLDLGLLLNKISEEAAKGPEVFEAFGLKFPAEQVSVWGGVVLMGVQLYLFLYLKKLSNKLEPDAAGWDMPWIAMDQSRWAQLVVLLTFVVLPIAAAVLAFEQVIGLQLPDIRGHWTGAWLELFKALCVLSASVALSIFSWIFRPRLREPVTPWQLFE